MHIGLSRPPTPPLPHNDVDGAVVARLAEGVGFEAIFYGEHPVTPVDDPGKNMHSSGVPFFQDTLVMLARASAVTTHITLGAGVFIIPAHHPVLFAKQLASLDYYSGGRLVVGASPGWSRVELEATGGDFDRRYGQTRESIELMKRLWTEDVVEFEGTFFTVPPVRVYPKPAQVGGPPVLLPGPADGGASVYTEKGVNALRRIVTYADGWIPAYIGTTRMREGVAEIEEGRRVLARLCAETDRAPEEISVTVLLRTEVHDGSLEWPDVPDRTILKMYEDIGVERVLVTIPTLTGERHAQDVLERLAHELL